MSADEFCYAGIRELGGLFRRGALSPVDYATDLLGRVERLDKSLNAYVTVTAERALADARAAEVAIRRGDGGPLAGIPIAYKDLYVTKGIRTTAGSALLADWVPDFDCTCVTRLQQAGMVMLGKLITHEFAFGIQFPGHRFPPARNPWNVDHIPGGSSSGSGAALAAGLTVGSLGSDTGGSIRGPAAPASAREPVPDYLAGLEGGVKGLRVGVVRDYFFEQVEPETVAAFERALAELGRLGATVRDVTIPSIHATPSFMVIMLTEAFAYHERDLRTRPELYGDVLREKLMAGGLFRADEYVQAQRLRSQIREDTARALLSVDVLVTPTALGPAPAFKVVLDPDFPFAKSNMGPFNITGLPTLAIPTGFSSSGLPLSMQISGRPFDEATVLRAGHAYQRATEWHRRRPPVSA